MLAPLAAVLALGACGGNSAEKSEAGEDLAEFSATSDANYRSREESAIGASDEGAMADDVVADAEEGEAVEAGDVVASPAALPVGRDIIVTVDVSIESDDVRAAVGGIQSQASTAGGYVASTNLNYGDPADDEAEGYAYLVIRVPTQSTQGFVDQLAVVGSVISSSQSTQDVTNEMVDLDVRIANMRDSVNTVRALLERSVDLDDVVTLERELNTRVTELERLEAQERLLGDQVAMSTVTITVYEPTAVTEEPDDSSIGSALRDGWDSFTTTIGTLLRAIASALPYLVTVALALLVAFWSRRRHRGRVAQHGGPSPVPPGGTPPTKASAPTSTVETTDADADSDSGSGAEQQAA